ncbi:MAG: adenylate/guanylate cyclase domain-containing protein [Candidatus Riflebacteria bacterium]|nr:adenylate/guanylate cyclase domain-containing protein [Candidatus Riflebacteria bacterium]
MRFIWLSWVCCIVLGLALYGSNLNLVDDAENRWLDMLFQRRGAVATDSRVVIVGIDQETLSWAARPMFAWGPLYGELAQAVTQASASVLMFDLIFSPTSEGVLRDHIRSVAADLSEEVSPSLLRSIGFDKPFRAALLNMAKTGTRLVLGFAWENGQPVFSDPSLLHIARRQNTGYYNIATSRDGVTRGIELYSKNADDRVSAVSVVAASYLASIAAILPEEPVQLINFRGARSSFPVISLKQVIETFRTGKSLNEKLAGKIVLVGFAGITDFKSTPFGFMPGVEIHASIIDNLLNHRFLKRVELKYEILAISLILLLLLVFSQKHTVAAVIVGIFAAFGWAGLSVNVFDSYYIPVVRPLLLLLTFVATTGLIAYRSIYFDRRRVRQIFSRYVSDSVLHEVLSSDDRDFMKGTRRHLCVMIADIRGFTTFSEKRDAHEVVKFLNAYFSVVTEIIMRHRGVVDKFLGDGLLAFFNAPVESADFADSALKATIEIDQYSKSPEFRAISHGVALKVGVALHVGDTVFGNIGSSRKTEFTVIGDTVNTCSRMESLNKEFATSIIVSGQLTALIKQQVNWRFLGKRSLRGKTAEIELYTVSDQE